VLIHRREELRASKIMQERALKTPKLSFRWNSVVTGLIEDGGKLGASRSRT